MAKKKVVQTNQGEEAAKKAFLAERDALRQAEADKAKAEKAKAEAEALANANAAGFDSVEAHAEAEALRAEKSRVEASKAEAKAKAKAHKAEADKAEKARAASASILGEAEALARINVDAKAEVKPEAAGVSSIGTGVQVSSSAFATPAKGTTGAGKAAQALGLLNLIFDKAEEALTQALRAGKDQAVMPLVMWGREALAAAPIKDEKGGYVSEAFKARTLAVALLQAEGTLPRHQDAEYGSLAKAFEGQEDPKAAAKAAKGLINPLRGRLLRAFKACGVVTQEEDDNKKPPRPATLSSRIEALRALVQGAAALVEEGKEAGLSLEDLGKSLPEARGLAQDIGSLISSLATKA